MSGNTSNDEVFEYMGNEHEAPRDVVSVRFHPSVIEIEDFAFLYCKSLREVVLNEGLEAIGVEAFYGCKSHYKVLRYPLLLLILEIVHLHIVHH